MIKAVIFDMDGVIADTEPLHFKALQKAVKEIGKKIDLNFKDYIGVPDEHICKKFDLDFNKFIIIKDKYFLEYMHKEIKPTKGIREFLTEVKDNGLKTALVTSSDRVDVNALLNKLSLQFDIIISDEDVTEKKPSPEPYLKALDKLGISNKEAIVIEDSPTGIESARNACIKVIAILTSFKKQQLKNAQYFINSFEDLNLNKIMGM